MIASAPPQSAPPNGNGFPPRGMQPLGLPMPGNGGIMRGFDEGIGRPQAPAFPDPETVPAVDEKHPQLHPNLADNEALCKAVTAYVTKDFWWGYEQQQMRFWPVWGMLDRMWRARLLPEDIDLRDVTKANERTRTERNWLDGISLKATPTDLHKQDDALLKIGLQMSFQPLPVRAQIGAHQFETAYNPSQQSVDALNDLIEDNARRTNLRSEYRKNFHSFVTYGIAWALKDMRRSFDTVLDRYPIPTMPAIPGMMGNPLEQQLFAALQQKYRGQEPLRENGHFIFRRRVLKEFVTTFRHLNVDDVFTDLMLPCDDMERHPCPIVRQHVAPHELEANQWHPEENPFGWRNVRLAQEEAAGHYTMSEADEGAARQRLSQRFGLNDATGQRSDRHTIKQLWTAFPLLRIDPTTGALDTGEGVPCPECAKRKAQVEQAGQAWVEHEMQKGCPACQGSGKVRPRAERYTVVMYGGLRRETVCLRIQKFYQGQRIPLKFAADQVEDTACAYPVSKNEIVMNDLIGLAKAEDQFETSKDKTINRGWKKRVDSLMIGKDCDSPGAEILFESNPEEVQRVDGNQFDETVTLLPYIQRKEDRIQMLKGATDQMLGMLAPGRRSALELGNAIDSAKNPIIVLVDSYNRQQMEPWADDVRHNIELWGDRDWIRKKTGREFFGEVRLHTSMGEEFVKKMVRMQQETQMLQEVGRIAQGDPGYAPAVAFLLRKLATDMGMSDMPLPDAPMRKGQQDAMQIVTSILGDGKFEPPLPGDPHQLYLDVFMGALKDPYWREHAPQNMPLLGQRIGMQQQLLMQQQMMEAQQQMLQRDREGGNPGAANPKKLGNVAEGPGRAFQNAQG